MTSVNYLSPSLSGVNTIPSINVSGNASINGNTTMAGSLTISSNLFVNGTTETIKSFTTISSNLVVNNYGTGPALKVTQSETSSNPVAQFIAGSTNALLIDNNANVAIGTLTTGGCNLEVWGPANFDGVLTITGANIPGLIGLNCYGAAITAPYIFCGGNAAQSSNWLSVVGGIQPGTSSSIYLAVPQPGYAVNGPRITLDATGGSGGGHSMGIIAPTSADITTYGGIQIYDYTAGVARMTIDMSGNTVFSSKIVATSFQIASGAQPARQFDCGQSQASSGLVTVSFNFTFSNTPIVTATASFNGTGYMWSVNIKTVSPTGFTAELYNTLTTGYSVSAANNYIQWIALG